jgi:predicted amidohydrolase YtcJ
MVDMTAAADLVLRGGEIRLAGGTYDAVAVRDERIVRRSVDYEADFLTGVETTVVDLDGRIAAPGFVDARAAFEADPESLQGRAARSGVTAVHATAGPEGAARIRGAEAAGELDLRVRLQHPISLRSALLDAGLRTNHGSGVALGSLAVPATDPNLRERALRTAEAGFQVAVGASDREAADTAAAVLADCRPRRHRIEGAVPHPDALDGFDGAVVVGGEAEGLAEVLASDATLAFGGAPPLETVAAAVEAGLAPETALRAHTHGGRVAGFDADAARADLVAFDGDPFEDPADASVALTVAGGELVHDGR